MRTVKKKKKTEKHHKSSIIDVHMCFVRRLKSKSLFWDNLPLQLLFSAIIGSLSQQIDNWVNKLFRPVLWIGWVSDHWKDLTQNTFFMNYIFPFLQSTARFKDFFVKGIGLNQDIIYCTCSIILITTKKKYFQLVPSFLMIQTSW